MSFSVTTVIDWGMSRSACLPLPMLVEVARTESLPCASSRLSVTVTCFRVWPSAGDTGVRVICATTVPLLASVGAVVPVGAALVASSAVWAQPDTEAAKIMALSGRHA